MGYRARSAASFDRLVDQAVHSLPPDLLGYLDNVEITVEDVPPADALESGEEVVLLGLYQGVPQTERDWGMPMLPDRITIYRRPLELRAMSRADLAMHVRETVVHEIAHHFGIDDDRLDEMGWG
jgi:predicted Zn-dependent protease with MMP-like domain